MSKRCKEGPTKESGAERSSISGPSGLRSGAAWIASAPQQTREAFLDGLTPREAAALLYLFEFWAHPHQLAPDGDWRTWVILGGRGAGKTRAGAEWIRSEVEGDRPTDEGRARRVALVAETYDQARDVMVFGESGLLACSPPDRRPEWQAGRRRLIWPNGAEAQLYSASDPEALRGPQFDAAWADELGKWKKADEVWDMLQFALRLGERPRQVVTTTPRVSPALKALLAAADSVSTHAPTTANRANLAPSFLKAVLAKYGGTRLGQQELDGVMFDDVEGALWSTETLAAAATDTAGDFDRIVVAVDPPVTGRRTSDDCGIVVAGARTSGPPDTWEAVVLEDASVSAAGPTAWATAAVAASKRWGADRIVAETNQGGDLVQAVIRQVDPLASYRSVRATRGKAVRAEPVAALYEQGRVRHLRGLGRLEDQMTRMTAQGFAGSGSPDRVDALVWALFDLMIAPAERHLQPHVRSLA